MARQIVSQLKQSLQPNQLLPGLAGGLITGILAITVSTAFASLIFSGPLTKYVSAGVGFMLFGSLLMGALMALTSSLPGLVAGLQEGGVAILALVSITISERMSAFATGEEIFFTVVITIALATVLTGITFLLLGQFKLGNLIRYIPYPVVGGFMAGTGMLLALGAISVMASTPVSLAQISHLLQPDILLKWLSGLIFAVVLLGVSRRYSHPLLMPGMLVVATLIFYGLLWVNGTSIAQATAQDWLLGPLLATSEQLWHPLSLSGLQQVNWNVVGMSIGSLITTVLITVLALLLNASGLELALDRNIDLNTELKAAGISNLIAGLGGSPPGCHILSDTTLVYKMRASTRLVGLTLAGVCGLVLINGGSLLSFFPNPVLGGLLLFLGLDFLVTWVYEAWFKLSRVDYTIVISILVVITAIGFMQGIALGLVLAVILFIVDYSRINVVKHTLSGANYQSNFEHPRLYDQLLRRKGEWIFILELQGYIFFGTAYKLFEQVWRRLDNVDLTTPQFVVLDFRLVTGLDSSAVQSFSRMAQLAQKHNIVLVFTHLSPAIEGQLQREVLTDTNSAVWRVYPDLDRGVGWCEEQVVQTLESVGLTAQPKSVKQKLEDTLPGTIKFTNLLNFLAQEDTNKEEEDTKPFHISHLIEYMERKDVEAGYTLIRQGEVPKGVYLIETGRITVKMEQADGKTIRLRTMGASTVVGELELYLGCPATASVITDQPSTIFYLLKDQLIQIENSDPNMAASFHKFIAQRLSERLSSANDTLQALLT